MNNQTCIICGVTYQGDGEPICGDVVCQTIADYVQELRSVVEAVEKFLADTWLEAVCAEYGI